MDLESGRLSDDVTPRRLSISELLSQWPRSREASLILVERMAFTIIVPCAGPSRSACVCTAEGYK